MIFKYLFCFILPVLLFSQNPIRFKVVDDNNLPISRAIVILSQNNDQIVFGTTNENGFLEKQIVSGQYDLKISKLGFTTLYNAVIIDKGQDFEFVLKVEVNKLKDVVITSRPKIMRIKGDTISYNLKAIVDGTENKIEDVIKKLPGLEVDMDGKVLYKGQQINNVLIDGNEFFGNKHQMATQNINAEMIEGIDLLTNYSGFALADGGYKGIALNLHTKDSYKNKWVSDVELGYGINNALRFHSNSFKFFKKGNLAILSDYNTIGKTPISLEDYREMRVASNIDNEDNVTKELEIPSFLNPNSLNKEKKNSFIGLTYTSLISPRAKITFSHIFNKTNLIEENNKTQTNIGDSDKQISFFEDKKGSYVLNNSAIKWEFNKSKTTFLSYVAGLTPNSDEDNQELLSDVNQINYVKSNTNLSFAQVFKLQTLVLKKINYKILVKQSSDLNEQSLDLFSQKNLFDSGFDMLYQKNKNQDRSFGLYNLFSLSKKSNIFTLKLNLLTHNTAIENNVFQNPSYDSSFKLKNQSVESKVSWFKNWSSKFQSLIGLNMTNSNNTFQESQNTFSRYEPNLSLIYNFSGFNKLTFNYALEHQLPIISEIQDSSMIFDFQTIFRPSLVDFSKIIPKNNYSLQYFHINTKTNSVLFSSISYIKEQNSISNNISYGSDYVENNMFSSRGTKSFRAMVAYDLKFKRLPMSIKTTLFYLEATGFSQFSGMDNIFSSNNFTSKMKVISNFKNSDIQFGFDYNYIRRRIEQERNNFNNVTINQQLAFSLRGKNSNKLKWDLGFIIDNQDSSFNTNSVFFLNANVQYVVVKDLKLIFNGSNMLNLNNNRLISTSYNQSFFTESMVSIMAGYLMLGVNYSL
ncbi:MAG: hypothetical protein ACI9FW_001680 [Flavobacterium sp.]